jgi:Flp pilus assembly protein TadG
MPSVKASRHEIGQSLVEVAVSFVILIILLEGAVDLGRALFALISIRDAAQEGAFYGSVNPTDTNGIIQRVRSSSNAPVDMSDASKVNVTVSIIGPTCSGGTIQVTVTYNFQFITPIVPLVLPGPITLHTTMTSVILAPVCP